jgi:hypothetical protein
VAAAPRAPPPLGRARGSPASPRPAATGSRRRGATGARHRPQGTGLAPRSPLQAGPARSSAGPVRRAWAGERCGWSGSASATAPLRQTADGGGQGGPPPSRWSASMSRLAP